MTFRESIKTAKQVIPRLPINNIQHALQEAMTFLVSFTGSNVSRQL